MPCDDKSHVKSCVLGEDKSHVKSYVLGEDKSYVKSTVASNKCLESEVFNTVHSVLLLFFFTFSYIMQLQDSSNCR